MNKIILTILLFISLLTISGQALNDSLFIKIEKFKKILDQADTLNAAEAIGWSEDFAEAIDSGFNINRLIAFHLQEILDLPSIKRYKLDSLLSHDFLRTLHSPDGNVWIFSWPSNNGGVGEAMCSIFYYRNKTRKNISDFVNPNSDERIPSVCFSGTWFEKIYKLKADNKNLYLCLSSGQSCSTCCENIVSVIEITSDKINFEYPAFMNEGNLFSSCYFIETRCGDMEKFNFDNKIQTLSFGYATDDNTWISMKEGEKRKTISGTLRWNGVGFIETITEK